MSCTLIQDLPACCSLGLQPLPHGLANSHSPQTQLDITSLGVLPRIPMVVLPQLCHLSCHTCHKGL